MADTPTEPPPPSRPRLTRAHPPAPGAPRARFVVGRSAGSPLLLLLVLGWKFLADPSLSAPTRDPAWYTWRAQVVLEGDPVRVVQEWGPDGLFAGGYRVSVPVAGALLQQVVGHRSVLVQRVPDDGDPDPHGPRAGRRVLPQPARIRWWC